MAITNLLKEIWLAGCPSIGDIPTVFESYALVAPPRQDVIKRELQSIYAEMKALQPRLPTVRWDK